MSESIDRLDIKQPDTKPPGGATRKATVAQAAEFVFGRRPPRVLPEQVRRAIADNQRSSEILVCFAQFGAIAFFGSFYELTPKAFPPSVPFEPVPWALGLYAVFTALRLWLALRDRLNAYFLGLSVVVDIVVLMVTIWSFHLQFSYLKRLQMTHQEVKDEGKEAEGDPYIRARRRDRARQIANNQMMLAVPDADVVIVNPTHYAVALKWHRHDGSAPVCLAKGVDEIALAIRSRAEEAGVPVRSDPPTARSLHGLVEIGQEIRPDQFQAVAAAIIFADEMRRKARETSK